MPSLDSIITFSTLAALVQFGIIISVILRVMLTRHPPGSAFAWILITTLLPYFGFILYLLFGERPIGQLRATRFRKHLAHLKELSRQKLTPTGPLPRHLARHRTLIHLATRMGNLPVTSGTEIRLLSSSDDTFAAIISDIEAACSSIDMEFYITAVALFCCSGFGWYSTLTEGIAGDPSLLFSKAVLDGFTALIFASTLGKSICAIPLPQCVILLCVFGAGRLLAGVLTPTMFADLSACGGVLTMAAGFRVSKIKPVPLVDLMPALLLVMPFSLLWTMLMG